MMNVYSFKKIFGWAIACFEKKVHGRSILAYDELVELVSKGIITADMSNINAASIDITLDNIIMIEADPKLNNPINLAKKESIAMKRYVMSEYGFTIEPNEFILASSREIFNLPNNISAEYKLKSSMARNGLDHLNAGWCDAGWNGSKLTLEFKNVTQKHLLTIETGMKCGQVVFFRHAAVPDFASYAAKGRYNGQAEATTSLGIA
jgi:dCTP deaminase